MHHPLVLMAVQTVFAGRYAEKANKFYDSLEAYPSMDGLWPNCWEKTQGRVTFGADGDSFYEYLIKVWLLVSH